MNLDLFNSFSDIQDLINESSSPDGETASFELKGTYGRSTPSKDDKKRFAKEICAFANSYGGMLCIHKGGDDDIQPFDISETESLFKRLESWSRDSLEPRCPTRLKIVDNHVIIGVGESVTKPHRSTADKHYYYRHETQSEVMPEIMVAALYRAKSVLQTSSQILMKSMNHGRELIIIISVKNESRVAGTNPKLLVQFFSEQDGAVLCSGDFLATSLQQSAWHSYPFSDIEWIKLNGWFESNLEFQHHILYPSDSLGLTVSAKLDHRSPSETISRLLIAKIDTMFSESARNVQYALVDIESAGSPELFDESELEQLTRRYRQLIGE